MATVTMKEHAALTEPKAREVIQGAGYEVVSFKEGAPSTRTAYLFRVSKFEPSTRASIENGLREDLKDTDRVAVDSLGRATVIARGEVATVQKAIVASLKEHGVASEGFETRTWPKLDATYEVALSKMDSPAAARTAADALSGVSKVVAVHVDHGAGTASLWLKEPCDALDANVRSALTTTGFSVSRFELVSPNAPLLP